LYLLSYKIYLPQNMPPFHSFVIQSLWRFVYFTGISAGYWIVLLRLRQRTVIANLEKNQLINIMEKDSIEKQLLMAENIYLKAQINPHFLFNTLGYIHNQVFRISAVAGD
jgi:two-component system LytT family sensor kinase